MASETTVEGRRLLAASAADQSWRRWGPYLSERQWGTVREDYSENGDAWAYFTHDQARSRAYRWGEDGIAGISDDHQQLCLAFAFWNGRDAVLKERLFGLTNAEGNHGEDVKELYFYLDSTPTHSYLKYLYKYPQAAFPYADLVAANAARGRGDFELELLDTGVFDGDRYFDIVVEYAKATPDDVLARVTVHNRGPDDATLRLLPVCWFRNTWSWGVQAAEAAGSSRPVLRALAGGRGVTTVEARHADLGRRLLLLQDGVPLLFTENETNSDRLWGTPAPSPYVKDGIDRFVVHGESGAVNPEPLGTKVAADYRLTVEAGGTAVVRLRLTDAQEAPAFDALEWDRLVDQRRQEADDFYRDVAPALLPDDAALVVRRGLAGLLWSKQVYCYDVERWLAEHGQQPLAPSATRNSGWPHLHADDVVSMPDKWEYPWFAAWDLAFQALAFSMVDLPFAKSQLDLLLGRRYLHPNGQIPAYEWNFGDVNPPVHAWAVYFVHQLEQRRTGHADHAWLENAFHKLSKNFTWWLNRKDVDGRNLFQGGFLGLDNIGLFDRSAPLPTGGHIDQADGTAWMALYCQNMIQIALELARQDHVYVEQAETFFEHFAWIASAVNRPPSGDVGMWDEEDGFFYDILRLPDGTTMPLKVRSMVGLLPLAAATVIDADLAAKYPELVTEAQQLARRHPSLRSAMTPGQFRGATGNYLLALFDESRLRRILARMLDESEFLSDFGLRSLSRAHLDQPCELWVNGTSYRVSYLPAESDTGMFGGNSNWRGPIWLPMNVLVIRALLNLYAFYGDTFTVECPTGSGVQLTLFEVAREISHRLVRIFLADEHGRRPVHGGQDRFATDPNWRDLVLFYEYFHGDNGAGIGASHQTGWTALVAALPGVFAAMTGEQLLEHGLQGFIPAG